MKELIDEMSYDLAECHVDYLDDAKLYTDYDTMAQKMVSRGYRRQSGWISVDERLPEDGETVLTISAEAEMAVCFYETTLEGIFQQYHGLVRIYNITHWMPLPEAPTMKGGAE